MSTVLPLRTRSTGLDPSSFISGPHRPSVGTSEDAKVIQASLDAIEHGQLSPGVSATRSAKKGEETARSLAERLYDASVTAKVMTAQVAMHLDRGWRERLFAQLDDLLNADDWHDDDSPVLSSSFATFLRMILYQRPARRPGLGLSHKGHLVAAWTEDTNRLTLEFLPRDAIRWVLSCEMNGERERATGETPVRRLPEVLKPYSPDRWFADADSVA